MINLLNPSYIIIFVILLLILLSVIKFNLSYKLEKRITRHSIKTTETVTSIYDIIYCFFNKINNGMALLIKKSKFLSFYSKIYSRKVNIVGTSYTKESFLSQKILYGILFVLIAVISKSIKLEQILVIDLIMSFITGDIAAEIFFFIKRKNITSKVENDLLQAIIIMNNSFKSGKSITQAVHIIANEKDLVVSKEFKMMEEELSLGLDISLVFKRFANRLDIEEATYLASSISILNKTGGNIVKIFDSIEQSLFSKKKISLEMDALTASSKIVLVALLVVPVLFVGTISLIDPNFFAPFFSSLFGFIYFIFILVAYFVYFLVLNKIMKVRL